MSDDGADAARRRPVYHFAPARGWMNDPNGLVYHDGRYHLFYQAGEDRRRWDHATSEDLVAWTEHGTKLPVEDGIQQFSGGGTVDAAGDAGVGPGALVFAYTGHHDDGVEDQRLAYSTDGARTVHKYEGNPVIESDDGDFRDPNLVRWGEEWRLVVSRVAATDDRPAGIEVYRSADLREWTHLDTFEAPGDEAWECPDLFRAPVEGGDDAWCLLVSADWERQELFVGDFDGAAFEARRRVTVDQGFDFYAGMTWANDPDRRLLVGWCNHWDYAHDLPDLGWTGLLTFPREVSIVEGADGPELRQRPAAELSAVRGRELAAPSGERIDPDHDPLAGAGVEGDALVIEATLDPGDADEVGLRVRESDEGAVVLAYDAAREELRVDRGDAGDVFADEYAVATAPLTPRADGTVDLQVLVDRPSVEVFAGDGRVAMSNLAFPDPDATGVSAYAEGGAAELVEFVAHEANGGAGAVPAPTADAAGGDR